MISSKKGKVASSKVLGSVVLPFVEDFHEVQEVQEVQEGIERRRVLL